MTRVQSTIYGNFSADFEYSRLIDICVTKGGVQTGPFGSQLHKEDYVSVGTPIITVEHLGENRILHSVIPCVSDEDRERLSKYTLLKGDIVFSRVGSVDRRALVREEEGWLFSGRCLRIRPNQTIIDPGYLSYFFGLPSFKEHIRAIAVGATMPSLNTKILSDVVIYYPKLSEQRTIAHILSTLDNKIECNRRINETLENIAQTIFKSWFVDFNPVRSRAEGQDTGLPEEIAELFPDSFDETEFGKIPTGWKIGTIESICESITSGGTPSRKNPLFWVNGTIPWFKTGELLDGPLIKSDEHITDAALDGSSCKLWPAGTILFALYASPTVGRLGVLTGPGTSNQAAAGLIAKSEYGVPFLRRLLLEARANLQTIAVGAAQQNINQRVLKSYRTVIPQAAVAAAYSQIISSLDEKQVILSKENHCLSKMRDELLPRLVSGELSVERMGMVESKW
nr:restriction endonuclease subunit S [uncultured Methanolobus sp.]